MTIDTKELRRLAQAALIGPDGVSMRWLKLLEDFQEEANPSEVLEILDRLDVAESECLEEARLNGMGSEREAALMAKLEAAEKEIALKERVIDALGSELNAVANERDALRAKVSEMEQQKPVRWGCTVLQVDGSWKEEIGIEEPPKDYFSIRNAFPLYALPGAQTQGEEK